MSQTQLVLLHGLNNTPAIWQGVTREMPAHVQIHAPALPALPDVDAIAEQLLRTLPDCFWLAGFSFGGYVAMAILSQAAHRVQGLALLCTTAAADTPAQNLGRRNAILAAAAGNYVEKTLEHGLAAFHPDHRTDPALLQTRREMVEGYGSQAFIAHALACMARPGREALLREGPPLLWVAGNADPLYPPQAMAQMRDQAGHGALQIIEPAGHLVPLEQPRQLAGAFTQWLATPIATRQADQSLRFHSE